MFTYATFASYFPGTDVKVADIEVRVHAAGDDRKYWSIEYLGSDDKWHAASDAQAAEILKHIENTDALTWADIKAAA